MPRAVKSFSSARNAFAILDEFLQRPELVDQRQKSCPPGSLALQHACLRWEHAAGDTLKSISLSVGPGEVLAVIGDVGSGKSSLLAAMLGQMAIRDGAVQANGRVSYCPPGGLAGRRHDPGEHPVRRADGRQALRRGARGLLAGAPICSCSRRATSWRSRSAAPTCRGASASACPWRGPSTTRARSCCWTTR